MKRYQILSIDFDFFQIVDKKTLLRYPDGIDLSTKVSTMVWAGYYTEKSKEIGIPDVKLDKENFDILMEILGRQRLIIPVMVCNSHKHIYDFIHDNVKDISQPIQVTNIDMHHDMFNDNDCLDCGNWVNHIKKDYKDCRIRWIAKETAIDIYGLKDYVKKELSEAVQYTLDSIKNTRFDAIFACRSDPWLPPHLDKYYIMLADKLCDTFNEVYGDSRVLEPRDYMEIAKQYEQADELRDLYKGYKGAAT